MPKAYLSTQVHERKTVKLDKMKQFIMQMRSEHGHKGHTNGFYCQRVNY